MGALRSCSSLRLCTPTGKYNVQRCLILFLCEVVHLCTASLFSGRYWDMVQRHKITVFYTAPTAIRSLMRFGDDAPNKYDLSSLKVLGTVGEPIK